MRRFRHGLLWVGLVVLVVAFGAVGAEVVKSPNDAADYHTLVLDNGLKVVLVSDADADKAAAALSVRVGAGNDPRERQGLAHFLEHMLFLGTEKYPNPGEYHQFIRANGGSQNAFTSYEFTTYYFEIDPEQLQPALDRFSQFFVAPLLTPRYVERELQAVESEFRARFESDARRRIDAQKEVLNPRHPYTKFQAGNLDTLSSGSTDALRDDLLEFYARNYSAGLMTLAVYGNQPIAVLREWVDERFGTIANTGATPVATEEPLIESARLPLRINVVPVKDQRSLILTFPIPAVREHYRTQPLRYLGELLGHEGDGSLLSVLKRRGWADALSAGAGLSHATEATFSVSIALTAQGLEHVDDIIALGFEQIRRIRREGVLPWMFQEQKLLRGLDFRFKQRSDPGDYVIGLSTNLHLFPVDHVLYGPYALEHFDRELIEQVLEFLVPENVLVTVTAKGLPTDRQSRWFQAPYSVSAVPAATVTRWRRDGSSAGLALPVPNEFVPEDLALKAMELTPQPHLIVDRPGLALWHHPDQSFGAPRSSLFVALQTDRGRESARSAAMTRLLVSMVSDALNEFSYPATLAGLGYSLYPTARGMTIRLSGYGDKQPLLLQRIVDALARPALDPERFAIIKERQLRRLQNTRHDPPYAQAGDELGRMLTVPSYSIDERIEALAGIDLEQLRAFVPQLMESLYVLGLAHGNITEAEARAMIDQVERTLVSDARPYGAPESQVVRLQPGSSYSRALDIEHDDSVVTFYFQGDDRSFDTRALFALLSQVVSSPFYTDLRTEQQLGYIVYATYESVLQVPGISFVIQSPVAGPERLRHNTETFLQDYVERLRSMADEAFMAHKSGLVSSLLQQDKTLWDRSVRNWYEIDRQQLGFDTYKQLAAAVRRIEQHDLVVFFERLISPDTRKTIVVKSTGRTHRDLPTKLEADGKYLEVESLPQFRAGQDYFERRGARAVAG